MKKFRFLGVMSVAMVVAVVALIGVAGANLSHTVGELEVAVTKTQNDTVLARVSDEELDFADPYGDGYVAPLGETITTGPDTSQILASAVSMQGMIMGILSVCLVVTISLAVRYWRRVRNSEE